MDYLRDLKINENRDIDTDQANDLALTEGPENLAQSVDIEAYDAVERFVGEKITATSIALLEEDLSQVLDADPQVGEVRTVSVVEFDKRHETVTAEVELTQNDSFEIEVSS